MSVAFNDNEIIRNHTFNIYFSFTFWSPVYPVTFTDGETSLKWPAVAVKDSSAEVLDGESREFGDSEQDFPMAREEGAFSGCSSKYCLRYFLINPCTEP